MMNIAICDDDCRQIEEISGLLYEQMKKYEDITFVSFLSGRELLDSVGRGTVFDLLFLDIEMPDVNGLELAKKAKALLPNVMVFFISSHESYVQDAFYLGAAQFLTKPLDKEKFDKEFGRVRERLSSLQIAIILPPHKNGQKQIAFVRDIIYIMSNKRQVILHTINGEIKCYGSFKMPQFVDLPSCFLRVHQSFIINMDYLSGLCHTEVICEGNVKVPISYNKRQQVKEEIAKYFSGVRL